MMRLIDMHSHCLPETIACRTTFFKEFWSDIDTQLAWMDENGVERCVLLYPTSDAHLNMPGGWDETVKEYNYQLAALTQRHPARFSAFGILSPHDVAGGLKQLEACNLSGVSMASSYDGVYLDDERFFPLYEWAQEANAPVHVHPQIIGPIGEDRVRDPLLSPVLEYVFDVSMCVGKLMMEGVLDRFPGLKWIFAHFGGVLPLLKDRFDTTYHMLRRRNFVKDLGRPPSDFFRNLYFDISGCRSPGALLTLLEMVPAGRVLLGSDYPANRSLSDVVKMLEQVLPDEADRKKVFGENASSLLSLTSAVDEAI